MSTFFVNKIEKSNIVTHGGKKFHGDDIFGIAFLDLLFGDVYCYRIPYNETIDFDILNNRIIFDTGNGKFDHHQKGGNGEHIRLNKALKKAIPYASFGLLWEEYGKQLLTSFFPNEPENFYEYMNDYIDFHLVRGIDAADNGIFPYSIDGYPNYRVLSISCMISFLNSEEELKDFENEGLNKAVELAKKSIEIMIRRGKTSYDNARKTNVIEKGKRLKDFEKTIYNALREEISTLLNLELFEKPIFSDKHSAFDTTFGRIWANYSDIFCRKICATNHEHVKNYLSSIIYGFCAEALGLGYVFPEGIDDMDCFTLGSLFSSREEYGLDYEKDLTYLFKTTFENALKTASFKVNSRAYVEEAVRKTSGHILILQERAYWQDWIANMPEAKKIWFVISPTECGTWKVKPVPCKYNPNGYRKGFPRKWFGYSKKENEPSRFDEDVFFIHSSGFLAVCKTLESARGLAEQALGNQENSVKEAISR